MDWKLDVDCAIQCWRENIECNTVSLKLDFIPLKIRGSG